jgi:hypothetical protein
MSLEDTAMFEETVRDWERKLRSETRQEGRAEGREKSTKIGC